MHLLLCVIVVQDLYQILPSLVNIVSLSTTTALDPHKLGIRCRVNGEILQDSNTDQLVHKTEALVSFISRYMNM